MAEIEGELWKYNFAKVTVVDVTEDYRFMLEPLPSHFYPVLKETLLPICSLPEKLLFENLVEGYQYDWHEPPPNIEGLAHWYVGVVGTQSLD